MIVKVKCLYWLTPESLLIMTLKTILWSVKVPVFVFVHQSNETHDINAGEQHSYTTFPVFSGAVLKGCEILKYKTAVRNA